MNYFRERLILVMGDKLFVNDTKVLDLFNLGGDGTVQVMLSVYSCT